MANNKSAFGMVTFAIGLLFGGLAALLFSTDESGKTKKNVQKGVSRVKQVMMEAADRERVREVFGKASAKANRLYAEARQNLSEKVEYLRDRFEKVDKERYSQVVNEVMTELKKDGAMTATQLKKLKNYFVEDYQRFTQEGKAGSKAKKATSKKA